MNQLEKTIFRTSLLAEVAMAKHLVFAAIVLSIGGQISNGKISHTQ